MKKLLLIIGLLMALNANMRAADYNYLVFTMTDGTTQSIAVTGLQLSFTNGNLAATNGTETLTIPLTNMEKMAFSNDTTTGISFTLDTSTNEGCDYYSLDGRRLNSKPTQTGVYIVKAGTKTYKVTVK